VLTADGRHRSASGRHSSRPRSRIQRADKLPPDIPARPQDAYAKEGWVGYEDWLGKEKAKRPFTEVRAFVHTLKLSTVLEWQKYTRSNSFPADIPKTPDRGYAADGWIDWGDWLGTGRTRPWRAKYRSFEEARSFVQSLEQVPRKASRRGFA
jgi:hypothetical protein